MEADFAKRLTKHWGILSNFPFSEGLIALYAYSWMYV